MTFRDAQAPVRSVKPALFAGLALFLGGALSIVSVNIWGQSISFAFIPLLVIAIWPRRANEIVSVTLVFAAGLFTDWASGGVTGQWALVFLMTWMLLRPELRDNAYSASQFITAWLAICGLALILLSLTGWFAYRILPDFMTFVRQIALVTVLLPLIFGLRHWLARLFGSDEDWRR